VTNVAGKTNYEAPRPHSLSSCADADAASSSSHPVSQSPAHVSGSEAGRCSNYCFSGSVRRRPPVVGNGIASAMSKGRRHRRYCGCEKARGHRKSRGRERKTGCGSSGS